MSDEVRPGRPFVVRRGEREPVWTLGGHFTTKLRGDEADERFSLVEAVVSRGGEPPMHIHHREDEAWYVLDGQMTFYVEDDQLVARPGDFIFAPRGLPHSFTVDIEPTRVLLIATPAGFEKFAAELGTPAESDAPPAGLAVPGPEVLGPVAERYGIEIIGPPIRVARGDAE